MSIERANFSCVMRYPIAAVCVFLLCIALPANSAAQMIREVFRVIMIIDGPGAGIRLYPRTDLLPIPTAPSPVRVIPEDNLGTQADGRIGLGPECLDGLGNQAPHFHGSLFGQGDPNPGACGWGRVAVAFSDEPAGIIGVSIGAEQDALQLEGAYSKNNALWDGINWLTKLINNLASMGNVPPNAVDLLNRAKALDLGALRALRDGNVQAFTSLVNEAVELKRELFPFLVGAGR